MNHFDSLQSLLSITSRLSVELSFLSETLGKDSPDTDTKDGKHWEEN